MRGSRGGIGIGELLFWCEEKLWNQELIDVMFVACVCYIKFPFRAEYGDTIEIREKRNDFEEIYSTKLI